MIKYSKTLKDLKCMDKIHKECNCNKKEELICKTKSINIIDLRQEAINWIKEWKRDSIEAMRTEHYPQAMISDAKIEAFMNFFNITDEELE